MTSNVRKMFELKGRNYVVTGGAQGIGFALTQAICEMGGNVAVLDLQEKPLEAQALASFPEQYGVKVKYIQTDVGQEESLKSGFEKAVSFLGGVDGLVAAAGIAIDKPFIDQTWEEALKIQQVNVLGTFFSAQLAAKQILGQGKGGSLVLIASITAHVGLPAYRMAAYNASKGGVKMLSNALATELASKGIRCNSISPGYIETAQTRVVREAAPETAWVMDAMPPMGRIGQPDDIVGAAIYLLSDASAYTTGTDVVITGGLHIGRKPDYAGLKEGTI